MKNPVPGTQLVRTINGIVFISAFHSHARVGQIVTGPTKVKKRSPKKRHLSVTDARVWFLAMGGIQPRGHRTFARLKKSGQLLELVRVYRITKCRHVHAAVDDPDNNVALRKRVTDVSEIRTATAAVAADEMAIKTSLRLKNLCAFEYRSTRRADDFFCQRWRIKVWRPRRVRTCDPERTDHNHT